MTMARWREILAAVERARADGTALAGGERADGEGPHEQGRAAIEFYTESVTIYQDAPLA